MKSLILIVSIMLLSGCVYTPDEIAEHRQLVTIEGCEYIMIKYDRSLALTHKGNCSNPIHVYSGLAYARTPQSSTTSLRAESKPNLGTLYPQPK